MGNPQRPVKLDSEQTRVTSVTSRGRYPCTVELALAGSFGHVYAFEINEEALTVLQQNIGHFGLTNVTVVAGDASQTLKTLDIAPDYAFIGGTKGNLASILDDLYDKNEACRMVITAISLKTLAAVTAYYAARNGYQLDITQVSAACSSKRGACQHHLMMAQNPVYIMTAVRQDAGEARPTTVPQRCFCHLGGAFCWKNSSVGYAASSPSQGSLVANCEGGAATKKLSRFGNRLAPLATGTDGPKRLRDGLPVRPAACRGLCFFDER